MDAHGRGSSPRARRASGSHHHRRTTKNWAGSIARSLGVTGSTSRSSMTRRRSHATRATNGQCFRFRDLRSEEQTLEVLLDVARLGRFRGWVGYPTRDETVAAISKHRTQLLEHFRIPTPPSRGLGPKWAWDKRKTPTDAPRNSGSRRRGHNRRERGRTRRDRRRSAVCDQAGIKERFVYATKEKAWRADTRAELTSRFPRGGRTDRRRRNRGSGADPRRRERTARRPRLLQGWTGDREHDGQAPAAAPARVRPVEQFVRT